MSSEAEKVVNDFCASFMKKNIDEIMAYFTDDAVYHNMPMAPDKGKDAIKKTISNYLNMANRVEFKILHHASNGNFVFNERIDMFDIGEKRIELPVAGFFEVKGNKVALWRDYFDMQQFTKQMS
jgi:limonene-1,2-epoxide hydrolase